MRILMTALLLVAAGSSLAAEGERFYQVMGPDGRMQTVKAAPASKPQPTASKPDVTALPGDAEAQPAAKAEAAPQETAAAKHAPYDGETYLDSDQLEQSGFNPENRKKFFITSDGMRQRVEENLMPATAADNTPEAPLVAKPAALNRSHTELDESFREVSPAAVVGSAGLCIDPRQAGQLADQALRLREDKRTVYFSQGDPLIASYSIQGQGLRTVQLRSYTDSIKSPSFFSPYIGLADDKGCVVRVLDNYFQRSYAVTKTQYEMLEAEITLHGEERYLLVLRAQPDAPLQPELAYAKSPFGQISLKFLK